MNSFQQSYTIKPVEEMNQPAEVRMKTTAKKTQKRRAKPIPVPTQENQTSTSQYFKLFNWFILIVMLTFHLLSPTLGVYGINTTNANVTGKISIFYDAIGINATAHHHDYNNSGTCWKEHSVSKREVWDDESSKESITNDNGKYDNMGGGSEQQSEEGFSAGKNITEMVGECESCNREFIRMKTLENIKGTILSKLGMSHPPNVTHSPKPQVADHLLMALLSKRKSLRGNNGVYWIVDEDSDEEMQGDEPYDSHSGEKAHGKHMHNKYDFMGSNDNKFSETNEFYESEATVEEEDDYHVKTERVVAFAQPHPRLRHLPHIQYFGFSDQLRASKVKRALLWMYIKGNTSITGNKISISIHKILATANGSRESPVITTVRADFSKSAPSGSGAWIALEYIQIRNLVAEWFRDPHNNLGIVISAEDASRTNLAVTSHSKNDTQFVPFLEVFVADNRKRRTKRTTSLNCKDSSKETRCCRYPLMVDFVKLGWDWIIAPRRYIAYYCSGTCPMDYLLQYAHTHVAIQAKTRGHRPCCAPKKLSELDMLYFDQHSNIVFGKIPSMIVDRCGCT